MNEIEIRLECVRIACESGAGPSLLMGLADQIYTFVTSKDCNPSTSARADKQPKDTPRG